MVMSIATGLIISKPAGIFLFIKELIVCKCSVLPTKMVSPYMIGAVLVVGIERQN